MGDVVVELDEGTSAPWASSCPTPADSRLQKEETSDLVHEIRCIEFSLAGRVSLGLGQYYYSTSSPRRTSWTL